MGTYFDIRLGQIFELFQMSEWAVQDAQYKLLVEFDR